jgi:hypothetical protein
MFFGDGEPDATSLCTYSVSATFYDLNDEVFRERWTMECKMPEMAITISSVRG